VESSTNLFNRDSTPGMERLGWEGGGVERGHVSKFGLGIVQEE
jgi:hypothetical protein